MIPRFGCYVLTSYHTRVSLREVVQSCRRAAVAAHRAPSNGGTCFFVSTGTWPRSAPNCRRGRSRERSWVSPSRSIASASGRVVALADQCPHRGYPLSLGTVVERRLGLRLSRLHLYDCEGLCVAVPGQDRIPSEPPCARYQVVEKVRGRGSGWVAANPTTRCCPGALVDRHDQWSRVAGVAKIEARFACSSTTCSTSRTRRSCTTAPSARRKSPTTPIEVEVDDAAGVVNVYRHMDDVECPPFYRQTTGLAGTIDRWQDIEYFAPGFYKLNSRIAPVGQPPLPDGTDDHAFHLKIFYGLTPSTESRVHDFWALSRDFCVGTATSTLPREDADQRRARRRRRAQHLRTPRHKRTSRRPKSA